MRDLQGVRCLRNEDFRPRVGLKRDRRAAFHFHRRLLVFAQCAKWFHKPLRVSHSVQNRFGCAKFFA